MDAVSKLREVVLQLIKSNVPVQTVWATCSAVNPEQGTMEATREGLAYYDVLLGIGPDQVVPVVGSKVLLGILENKAQATFLIMAEAIEERRLNGNGLGGLVMVGPLVARINALEQQLNQLKGILNAWVPVPNDGGSALKVSAASWAGQPLPTTTQQQLANPRVTHG